MYAATAKEIEQANALAAAITHTGELRKREVATVKIEEIEQNRFLWQEVHMAWNLGKYPRAVAIQDKLAHDFRFSLRKAVDPQGVKRLGMDLFLEPESGFFLINAEIDDADEGATVGRSSTVENGGVVIKNLLSNGVDFEAGAW